MTDPAIDDTNEGRTTTQAAGLPLPFDPLIVARQLLRKLWLFGLCAVISVAVAIPIAIKFGTQTWCAETVLVCEKDTPAAIADILTLPNIKTLQNMVKLRGNIEEVRRRLKLPMPLHVLGSCFDVEVQRSSALMILRATADDPKVAADMANTMAEVFIESQQKLNQQKAMKLANHYRQQYEEALAEMKKANRALRDFTSKHNVADISKEIQTTLEELVSVDMLYEQTKAEAKSVDMQLHDMEDIIKKLQEQVKKEQKSMAASETLTNLRIQIDRLQDRITRARENKVLEAQLAEARVALEREKKLYEKGLTTKAALEEAQTKVKVLEAKLLDTPQIAAWKKEKERLDNIVVPENNKESPTNAMLKDILMKKFDLELQKASLKNKVDLYKQMHERLKKKISELPDLQAQYVELERAVQVAQGMVEDLKKKLDAAESVVELAPAGVKILAEAKPPPYPTSSTRKLIAAGVTFVLFCMSSFLVLAWELHDLRPKAAGDVRAKYKIEPLIEIPIYDPSEARLMPTSDSDSAMAEHMRFLSALLHRKLPEAGSCVLITSTGHEEGKTVLAWNLAASLARIVGGDVVVLEADIRGGAARRHPNAPVPDVANVPGLTDVLAKEAEPENAIVDSRLPGVRFVHCGHAHIPPELLGNTMIGNFFAHLKERAAFIVIDGPPIMPFVDAEMLSSLANGVIWVVRAQYHGFLQTRQAANRLKQFPSPCLGAVVTFVPSWCYGWRDLDVRSSESDEKSEGDQGDEDIG